MQRYFYKVPNPNLFSSRALSYTSQIEEVFIGYQCLAINPVYSDSSVNVLGANFVSTLH